MGEIQTVKCSNCGYQKDYQLGAGMFAKNLDISKKQFSLIEIEAINRWIEAHGCIKSVGQNLLGKCSKCRNVDSFYSLELSGTDGETTVFTTKCKSCHSDYRTTGMYRTVCPECKSRLTMEVTGHWD